MKRWHLVAIVALAAAAVMVTLGGCSSSNPVAPQLAPEACEPCPSGAYCPMECRPA